MIARILGVCGGIFLILLILMARGIPVLFFIKMLPLVLLLLVAIALIWAGITTD
jgi:hypothetical protein